jgi:hypothetical protein
MLAEDGCWCCLAASGGVGPRRNQCSVTASGSGTGPIADGGTLGGWFRDVCSRRLEFAAGRCLSRAGPLQRESRDSSYCVRLNTTQTLCTNFISSNFIQSPVSPLQRTA